MNDSVPKFENVRSFHFSKLQTWSLGNVKFQIMFHFSHFQLFKKSQTIKFPIFIIWILISKVTTSIPTCVFPQFSNISLPKLWNTKFPNFLISWILDFPQIILSMICDLLVFTKVVWCIQSQVISRKCHEFTKMQIISRKCFDLADKSINKYLRILIH